MTLLTIIHGDNEKILPTLMDESVNLIYIDPPFNTGKVQKNHSGSYEDSFLEFENWIKPKILEAKRLLSNNGSFFLHLDYREVHYIKVMCDQIFGRDSFQNEIIWAYDYGGRAKTRWSTKHDTILWYVKDPKNFVFHYDSMDRVPYMAPSLAGKEKAEKGKTPTDVWNLNTDTEVGSFKPEEYLGDLWWQTIVPTQGKERTGYPTQKPVQLLQRIVKVHTNVGDTVLDFFAGSGTTGDAACGLSRNAMLIDQNLEAINVMKIRLKSYNPIFVENSEQDSSKNNR